ncbi:hypothetical protein ABPG72_008562 [Tetrahymena utriculariae]
MSRREKQSQEDIFLELKLIAFRKKLEEEKDAQIKVNDQKQYYESEKVKTLSRFNQRCQDNLKQSLPFSIPVGLGSVFLFKSILIFPITIGLGFCLSSLIINSKNQNQTLQLQK